MRKLLLTSGVVLAVTNCMASRALSQQPAVEKRDSVRTIQVFDGNVGTGSGINLDGIGGSSFRLTGEATATAEEQGIYRSQVIKTTQKLADAKLKAEIQALDDAIGENPSEAALELRLALNRYRARITLERIASDLENVTKQAPGTREAAKAEAALKLLKDEKDGPHPLPPQTSDGLQSKIRSIYVPIFNGTSLRRSIEFQLTEAVVKQIQRRAPFDVVREQDAETRLIGTIKKSVAQGDQTNDEKSVDSQFVVDVTWEDLRTGKVLAQNKVPVTLEMDLSTPDAGQSLAGAAKQAIDRMATEIVNILEMPW